MAEKEQFMALVESETLERLDTLRIVMGVSRAEVNRRALVGGGLKGLERREAERIGRLVNVAGARGMTLRDFVRDYVTTYVRKYGPTLEILEQETAQEK